ncbi:pyridoxal kinase [Arhodomonas sp. AD133]|uniref:pyridoxal kinase n=1 Tax=Arhodomonas sp. AD133 TaxID=3415009 RepID=UPI003EC14A93
MHVLSIQSQLVYGYAGNSAAVPALQRADIDVSAVPTVLLTNNPHYPDTAGGPMRPDTVAAHIATALERIGRPDAVITGFLGDGAIAAAVADELATLRSRYRECPIICDPVLGDEDVGRVLDDTVLAALRDTLVPAADLITPNRFELSELLGIELPSVATAVPAARTLIGDGGPSEVVVTGLPTANAAVATLAVTAEAAWCVPVPHIPVRPVGTGDVFTALLTAHRLRGRPLAEAMERAVAGLHAVLVRTHELDREEMALVTDSARLLDPAETFDIERLD